MARRCFFSFHYAHIFKVNQVRNLHNIVGTAAAGFHDASLWESSKGQPETIKRLIREALSNTSVTVVFVTHGTADRTYIDYEIDKSLERGNGLVAIQIHHLKDPRNSDHRAGRIPPKILANGFKAYKYTNGERLLLHIEEAAKLAGK